MITLLATLVVLIVVIVPVIYVRHQRRQVAHVTETFREEYHPAYAVITDIDADEDDLDTDFDDVPTKPEGLQSLKTSAITVVDAPWRCNCGECGNCRGQQRRLQKKQASTN